MLEVVAALRALADCIEAASGELDAARAYALRAQGIAQSIEEIAAADDSLGARSAELNARGFAVSLLPYEVATRFRALVQARPCGWIFTSATLGVGDDFGHFASRLGLTEARSLQIPSPFDYQRQALLYLPAPLPAPGTEAHLAAVVELAATLIDAADGGAFLLFTSHRGLTRAAQLLRARMDVHAPALRRPLFVQGEQPRERLLREFRASGHAVLLGTASFWEGVDVKGQALRLVIIDKLPFASPEDPVTRARIRHIEQEGGNAFRDYQLPETALALKQGVGRLIRSEEDEGVVVLCDPRLSSRSYGRTLLAALPPMRITRDAAEVAALPAALPPARQRRGGRRRHHGVARVKLLALDTATESCSAALWLDGAVHERAEAATREHARLILPMIDALLAEAGLALAALDAIAFGRGPGGFTGVRLAASVTQGLAFSADLPVLPVSSLRAVAQLAFARASAEALTVDAVLACQDARMHEVYWALHARAATGVELVGDERVGPPAGVSTQAWPGGTAPRLVLAGTGLRAYAAELAALASTAVGAWHDLGPNAAAIARLGADDYAAGKQRPAEDALPVYVRDVVARASAP